MRSASSPIKFPLFLLSAHPEVSGLASIRARNFLLRFKIPGATLAISIFTCILFSCNAPQNENPETVQQHTSTAQSTTKIPTVKTAIGSSGFSVELPVTHHIETQQNEGFTIVYYITPSDTVAHPGEAGMYFGPTPNVKPPSADYTLQEIDTVFLGKKQKWIEYTTALYTQRETFIDENNGQYIHFWCYSNSPAELDNLFRMMLSISR